MTYDVRIEQHTGSPLAVVRRHASLAELKHVVPNGCGTVWKVMRAQGVQGMGRNVALYLDAEINLEVGVELAAPFAGHGDVVGSATPTGTVAATTHVGPYAQLPAAHQAIRSWCQNNGYKMAGPSWELYGHWQPEWNNDPSQIRTDVYYLLVAEGS